MHRHTGEDLRITRPAEAFIMLRAVGCDVDEMAIHAPLDVVLQLVDRCI